MPTAVLVVLLASPGAAPAQLGLRPIPDEQFEALPVFGAPAAGGPVRAFVDLRDAMPPVADQGLFQSSVGWAVGYALKTYQESLDQGFGPGSRGNQMSPWYVWNRLNGGKDVGISLYDALLLLFREGCATRAAMPEGRPDLEPPPAARGEAPLFRIRRVLSLRTGAAIREALSRGIPVVAGVVVSPTFATGRFEVFDRALHERAEQHAGIPAAERGHALTLVGYDDHRRAFLATNSWGPGFGADGHVFLSYDLFDRIPAGQAGSLAGFVTRAYVAEDIRSRRRARQRPLEVTANARYAGVAAGKPLWHVRAHLDGLEPDLDRVDFVVWAVPDGTGRTAKSQARGRRSNFSVKAHAFRDRELRVAAHIGYRDGTTGTASARVRPSLARRQQLRLAQSDRYFGMMGGKHVWEWTVRVEGNLVDVGDIERVHWTLGRSFADPDRVRRKGVEAGYALTALSAEPFDIRARLEHKDGTELARSLRLQFRDRPRQLALATRHRPLFRREGKTVFAWSAWLDGPAMDVRGVRSVVYELPEGRVTMKADGSDFEVSRFETSDFVLSATVTTSDGRTRTLRAHVGP